MTRRMLIDAAHAEETRIVVADETKMLDYDHESSIKRQIKGNFYLAKVTRVEPSLQAAFVEFGGNRHGFLSFNEIHPDYYKIPMEDREALLKGSAADAEEADETDEAEEATNGNSVEELGGDESDDIERAGEAQRRRLRSVTRQYKIQEVIKRRQILLVQVVKEERGNKGAALTTYLSLAGRYCVLMPNTARGGGISRKITSPQHRKRLRSLLQDLEVPTGMGVILRTAGVERSKAEIKRDYEYLRRQWDKIRERTLDSTAPALIYEEGNVIKRALRDIYTREIEEVLIDGEDAYKVARDFMKTMIPSHVKRIKKYEDTQVPMFHRYGIEAQLDSIHEQTVHLPSGGYIVLNSTEALVAVDVNSGRATRQRNIEQTALHTNLEAAEEVARQLCLRDLAGLVVIDFIDMEEHRNNSSVERRLKESMRIDRARIQVGHISHFGLLELSRQRLRPSLVEVSTRTCTVCGGAGVVRSTESTSLKVLRAIEEEAIQSQTGKVKISLPTSVALYVLNQKRSSLADIEQRHDLTISINADDSLITPNFRIEPVGSQDADEADGEGTKSARAGRRKSSRRGEARGNGRDDGQVRDRTADTADEDGRREDSGEERGRRRRRRSRRKRDDATVETGAQTQGAADGETEAETEATDSEDRENAPPKSSDGRRRRRRGRSGRRGRTRAGAENGADVETSPRPSSNAAQLNAVTNGDDEAHEAPNEPAKPRAHEPRRPGRSAAAKKTAADKVGSQTDSEDANAALFVTDQTDQVSDDQPRGNRETANDQPKSTAKRSRRTSTTRRTRKSAEKSDAIADKKTAPEPVTADAGSGDKIVPLPDSGPRRRGWWNKDAS
ncbi:MAG: ribonuclease E/G [Alphaproteobacteria bacterium]|nr:ribonuclease E/G [Alphaproteobacteria bacterium]